jgi:integrase
MPFENKISGWTKSVRNASNWNELKIKLDQRKSILMKGNSMIDLSCPGTANPLSPVRFRSAPPIHQTLEPDTYTRTIDPVSGFVSLSFDVGCFTHVILTGLRDSELTPSGAGQLVVQKRAELERPAARALAELVKTYKYDSDFGGNDETRRKNGNHLVDLLTRDGIDLDGADTRHLNIITGGKSLPEQWERYNLPHKVRQLTSIFSKKNLKVWKRLGWDTNHFGAFSSYTPATCEIRPFSTDDLELQLVREKCEQLKDLNPQWHKIYLLAAGAGLRASEIYQVKFEDLRVLNGQTWLFLPFATKRQKLRGTSHTEKVGIAKGTYDSLKLYQTGNSPSDLIVGGIANQQRVHKAFVRWLKSECGFTDTKAVHRLRKLLGARLATGPGLYHAARTLRNSITVCEKFYSDLVEHKNDFDV